MDKVVHFEIPVDDLDRAKKFYSSIFGWELQDYQFAEGMTYRREDSPRGRENVQAQRAGRN